MRKLNEQYRSKKLSPYLDLPLDMILWNMISLEILGKEKKKYQNFNT